MKEKFFGIAFLIILIAIFGYLKLNTLLYLSLLLFLYFLITFLFDYYKKKNVEISEILNFLRLLFILIGILMIVFSFNLEKYGIAEVTVVGLVMGLAAQHVLEICLLEY